MISWIVIAILVIVALFVIKISYLRHKFLIIFLIILALFLYTTLNIISEQNSLDFTTVGGFFHSIKIYWGWLSNGFHNIIELTGKAIKMDWKSSNETFFKENSNKDWNKNRK